LKYLFILSEKFYRLVAWEWRTLKRLRKVRRKHYILRGSFALLSLFSILGLIIFPPLIICLLSGEGIKIEIFFMWVWILNLKFF